MATQFSPSDLTNRLNGSERRIDLDGFQATPATASIAGKLIQRPATLRSVSAKLLTAGTAGSTTVQVHKNGVSAGSVSITGVVGNNGVLATGGIEPEVALAAGDIVELVVSAIPTGGADLAASAYIVETA